MARYKRFLFSAEKMQRHTAYRRRLRAAALQKAHAQNAQHDANRSSPRDTAQPLTQPGVHADENAGSAVNDASQVDSISNPDETTQAAVHIEVSDPPNVSTNQEHEGQNISSGSVRPPLQDLITEVLDSGSEDTLCPCTTVTANDIVVMVVALAQRHNLTWVAQVDILKLIASIFPNNESIPHSKHHLLTKVNAKKCDITYHVYCSYCDIYLSPSDGMNKKQTCPQCKNIIDCSKAANYFCSLQLQSQLKDLLEGPENVGSLVLSHRVDRKKECASSIADIYDGSEYQNHCKAGGVLSSPHNFSYNFFTDGAPLGNSNKTVWPIYISINELPEKLRGKYILLAGIYVGPHDPNLNIFLKPFVSEANKLSTEGVNWAHNGKLINSKVIPMCAVADSVARCKLLNMQTFHSYWGCTFCYHLQERTSSRLKFTVSSEKVYECRTRESMQSDVVEAYARMNERKEGDRHFRGVKGYSCLAELKYFDISRRVVVDYMHCILLGVVRSHMDLLFDANLKSRYWSIDNEFISIEDIIASVDQRLLSIKPPKSVTRPPQTLSKRKNWKASEWRSWIVFYCIVCLKDLLKDKLLIHLAMLSKATNIVLQKSVTYEEVEIAHNLFTSYQYMYQSLFGKESMVYNIHLLSHICQGVLRFGPVWTHNAFMFEGQNRYILQLCRGPFNAAMQISRRYLTYKSFPKMCIELSTTETALDFCEDILDRRLKQFVRCSSVILIGKVHEPQYTTAESVCIALLYKKFDVGSADLVEYKRMLVHGFRVSSWDVGNKTRNLDCFVSDINQDVLLVKHIFKLHSRVIILVQKVVVEDEPLVRHSNVSFDHVKIVNTYESLFFIKPEEINNQCVYMKPCSESYICKMPYGCYKD